MKYTPELTARISELYLAEATAVEIADIISKENPDLGTVPERSIIAKLSTWGIYKKKEYRTKRGEVPIKKQEYIEQLVELLDTNRDFLESLEKVNKAVLALLVKKLTPPVEEDLVSEKEAE